MEVCNLYTGHGNGITSILFVACDGVTSAKAAFALVFSTFLVWYYWRREVLRILGGYGLLQRERP